MGSLTGQQLGELFMFNQQTGFADVVYILMQPTFDIAYILPHIKGCSPLLRAGYWRSSSGYAAVMAVSAIT